MRSARDLHDLLGHTLSMITLKSELAARLAAQDSARAAKEMEEVEAISRKALTEVRQAVRGYRSLGLEAEVANAQSALASAGVAFEGRADRVGATPGQENVLALALREAVTNVVRHAHATSCRVRLWRDAGGIHLEVADDGRGGLGDEGSGLAGMRERVEAIGGRLRIQSGDGTTLRVTLPAPEMPSAPTGTEPTRQLATERTVRTGPA